MGKRRSVVVAPRSSLGPLGARVRDEQVAMLFARNRVPTLIGIPFSLLVCGFAWADGRHPWLLAWLALKLASTGARVALDALYFRQPARASAATWSARYVVTLGLDGFAWSLLILLFTTPGSSVLAPVMIAAVIGIGAAGLVALSTDARANAVFAVALLVPGAGRLLLHGTRLGLFGCVAMLLFLGLVLEHGARVSEATAELLRLRFDVAHARDAALAATKAKSEFLATMSHELRTPLNAVIGMAALLADTDMSPDQRERLDVIRASGDALLMLIGDILDLSKIEAGKLEVEAEPVDIARVVQDALAQVAPAAVKKGLETSYEISDGCPAAIVSDAGRVRQILGNLLGNAVKFTPEGSVAVNVVAAPLDEERMEVTFAVHDTGIGIDPQRLAQLFLPFTQADATTTRRYGGTGLGLAICKSLCELLGGTIGVESASGEGSSFHFSIVGKPVDRSHLPADPVRPRQTSPVDVPTPTAIARVASALVVDDNDLNRRVALEMVVRLGLSARAVGSGAQAIEAVRAERFDYILMDVQMPDMDGFEATRRILGIAGKRKPRVIAMTANALPGDRERCMAAGMSDYVTKPVRPAALAAALRQEYEAETAADLRSTITDVLDARVLEDLRMLEATSGTPLIADLAASFRADVPARMEELRTAAGAREMDQVRGLAHRLRGSAGAVGANRVFLTATDIETNAAALAPEALDAHIGHLAKEVARAIDALNRLVDRVHRQPEGDAVREE
jgi:signal transduction histidine kinase/CheY-like chemotaxis protein